MGNRGKPIHGDDRWRLVQLAARETHSGGERGVYFQDHREAETRGQGYATSKCEGSHGIE